MTTASTTNVAQKGELSTPSLPAYAALSFVRIDFKGKRSQRVTTWLCVPDEAYGDGWITGLKVVKELMQFAKENANHDGQSAIQNVTEEAQSVIRSTAGQMTDAGDKRGAACAIAWSMAEFALFASLHCDHSAFIDSKIQRQLDWQEEFRLRDAERNRATGKRLAAARAAKRAAMTVSHA